MRRSIIVLLLLLTAGSALIALATAPAALRSIIAPAIRPAESSPAQLTPAEAVPGSATVLPSAPAPPAADFPTATSAPAATVAAGLPIHPAANGYAVRYHPEGELYVGDQVSFEVVAPVDALPAEQSARVDFPGGQAQGHAEARFGPHGIGARQQADLLWVWDTAALAPGDYTLTFSVQPGGPQWTETLTLRPRDELPSAEHGARWEQAITQCCKIDYISGTAAARDIEALKSMVDAQAADASRRLGIRLDEPVEIVLLPRVLGQGGFASREISVSYLDRDYIGGDKARIIHHEIIHILDGRLGGELRPSMFVEGLAVYLSDGHFKHENLLPRAAALLPPQPGCAAWNADNPHAAGRRGCGLDRFVPLRRLIDNFYYEQHEIGYLESSALIAYMVERWGWDAYSGFYRDIHPPKADAAKAPPPGQQSYAVEIALQKHFGLNLQTLENDFRQALEAEPMKPEDAEDLRLSLLHFDTARRYQAALDPSAHFLTAWLVDSKEMQKRGITADYLRHPSRPENLALETMLSESSHSLLASDYEQTDRLLTAANRVLDAYPQEGLQAFNADPIAASYLALVELARAQGYDPQRISLANQTARMWVSTSGPELVELNLVRQADQWVLLSYGVQLHRMPLSALNGAWQ